MVAPLFRRKGFPQHKFPAQPQAPGPDNPPFGQRSWLPIVLATWVTVPIFVWQTIQVPDAQAQVPPERAWVSTVLASWEPEQQITQGRRFVPQVAAAQSDNPPFGMDKGFQTWEPETWSAQKQLVLAPPRTDNPPGWKQPKPVWEADDWSAQKQHIQAQTPAAQVDNPPFGAKNYLSTRLWEPDTWSAQKQLTQVQPGAAAQVDNPPPDKRRWLSSVTRSWIADPVFIWRFTSAIEGPAVQVDNPPFGAKNYQSTRLWEAETWVAQKQRVTVQPGDAPFGAHPWLLIEWVDDEATQQARRLVPQSGVVVTQPFVRTWLPTVLSQWEQDWKAQSTKVIPQGEQVDSPPQISRNWLQGIVQSWDVTWSAQEARFVGQGTPAQVDSPPFGLRPYLNWTLPQFEVTWNAQSRIPIGWLPDGPIPVIATTIYPIAMFPIGMGWR